MAKPATADADDIPTPQLLLQRARALLPALSQRAEQAARQRRVPEQTVEDLRRAGLFRVLQARRYGGYEMPPEVFYEIQMTLARACMSTAWIYGVIAVHNWQMALLDDRASQEVWARDPSALIASSYMPKGQVTRVDGGFRFSGRWGYSSGIDHCQWVLLGGLVPALREGEPPEYRTFLLPRRDIEVLDTWDTMGLRATGSHDVLVRDAFVPEHRTHRSADGFAGTSPGLAINSAPLYRLPFGQIFVRAVSSSAIGALQGALEVFRDFAGERVGDMGTRTAEQGSVQVAVAETAAAIDEMKLVLQRNFAQLMDAAERGVAMDIETRLHYRYQAASVVERCAQLVYRLFVSSGARGLFNDNPLVRHFLDIHAGRTHYANNPDLFARNYGGVLLGRANTDFFI
ncbi:flavin-dependent monooxygenase [Solimonas aquatica]|uniref:flavin-dependent monooxygenase n=1 Tax=Solimonas aquatica TaxID=489703 RepID=UPI003F5074F5